MASPAPRTRTVSDIKATLLNPATTSHYEVSVGFPETLGKYLQQNGVRLNPINKDRLNLMCCEATLPGSNLATLEITGDFHGVTERHAYRRVYDDRIDLTFYVDAEYYLPIRVFETWIKYIAQEASDTGQADKGNITSRSSEYFYRFNYPDNYVATGLSITKFERSSLSNVKGRQGGRLNYEFIRSYPISISSMPISYESSSLLKCTVSMTYIRYILSPDQAVPSSDQFEAPAGNGAFAAATPEQQAAFNTTSNNLTGVGALATNVPGLVVGGIPLSAASSSGTTPGGIPSTGNAATGNINANIA